VSDSKPNCLLPLPLPEGHDTRTVLFAIRRMAAHGIRDVSAAWLMIDLYSTSFRRPLVLLRAFMLELAQVSRRTIRMAPCCAPRMTRDEGLLIETLVLASFDEAAAGAALSELTHSQLINEPLSAAVVFSRVRAELGSA
jgi:hypothetical protein